MMILGLPDYFPYCPNDEDSPTLKTMKEIGFFKEEKGIIRRMRDLSLQGMGYEDAIQIVKRRESDPAWVRGRQIYLQSLTKIYKEALANDADIRKARGYV